MEEMLPPSHRIRESSTLTLILGFVPQLGSLSVWTLNKHDQIMSVVQKQIMQTPLTLQDSVNANHFHSPTEQTS